MRAINISELTAGKVEKARKPFALKVRGEVKGVFVPDLDEATLEVLLSPELMRQILLNDGTFIKAKDIKL